MSFLNIFLFDNRRIGRFNPNTPANLAIHLSGLGGRSHHFAPRGGEGGGGGLLYITDGDARRNFQKQPLKSYHIGCGSSQFYSLKVTLEIFIHRNSTGKLKIVAKRQQVLL